jgi:hypothetical protein
MFINKHTMKLPKIFEEKQINHEYFIEICCGSISMAEAAKVFDLPFTTFKRAAIKLGCYKTNQSGIGILKSKVPLEDILSNKVKFSRGQLKKRLLIDGLLQYKCYDETCTLTTEWNGKVISLELDHINGVNDDNQLDNLRLLCPNCHSQTPTFRNKKR